jgi:hypothetical protein
MKNVYALQPYEVGSTKAKSLAIVIPSRVAKKFDIDTSTIFILNWDEITKIVTLQTISTRNSPKLPNEDVSGVI